MPKIIILGQPNVGKSSLFNCLLRSRVAITSGVSGTTRDLNLKALNLGGVEVTLCDSAGIFEESSGIFAAAKAQIAAFLKGCDLALYVIDGANPINDYDIKAFRGLQNALKSALIVNKMDLKKDKSEVWEYGVFDAEDIFYISTAQNATLSKLRRFLEDFCAAGFAAESPKRFAAESTAESTPRFAPQSAATHAESGESAESCESFAASDTAAPRESAQITTINIGIIGRTNVGKSSLLNALLGRTRSLVSEVSGTTIDPVDEAIFYKGKTLNFIDTAGIRQRSKMEGIEKYAMQRTGAILEKSDIALLVLDASREFVDLDEKIGGLSDQHLLGVIIVLNKWDAKRGDFAALSAAVRRRFAYLAFAPIITASALNGRHIAQIKDAILEVYAQFSRRLPTAILNETIAAATKKHPLPSDRGRMLKIYYATQIAAKPPQIVLVMNRPNALHFSYRRYLVNVLREKFGFGGSPILILPRPKNTKNEGGEGGEKVGAKNEAKNELEGGE